MKAGRTTATDEIDTLREEDEIMMTLAEFETMLDSEVRTGAISSATKSAAQQQQAARESALDQAAGRRAQATVNAKLAARAAAAPVAEQKTESAFVAIEDSDAIARTMRGQLAAGKRKGFILAGNAIFTVRSKATQTRFTYKVQQSDPAKCRPGMMPVYFVSLLNGADNTGDFAYIGTIFADGFRVTRKSRVAASAPSAIAFSWLMKHLEDSRVEVWHEGRCGRCGRTLTVPESIESGIGPICATK